MSIILIFLLLLLAIPFFLVWGFLNIVTFSFEKLGLSPEIAVLVLALMLVGSFFNIPLGRRKFVEVQESYFFGLMRRPRMVVQGLSINVGGAIIPIILAGYFLSFVPLQQALLVTVLMIVVSWKLARFVPGKGIAIPAVFPALLAALFAFVLVPEFAGPVAFISGVFGVLIGADLLHLPKVEREASGMMSIGGAGVFDGIFLIAIISALLTSF